MAIKRRFRFKMDGTIALTTEKPAFIIFSSSKEEAEIAFKEWKERIAQSMNPFQGTLNKEQN